MEYEKRIEMLGALLSQDLIEDAQFSKTPWITDRVQVPGTEWIVSLDMLNTVIHVYELQTGNNLPLTAEDIVNLYSVPNEEKQAAFDRLGTWYAYQRGADRKEQYNAFATISFRLYQDSYGKPFADKERIMLTSEEEYELAIWGLENINYELLEETAQNPNSDYISRLYAWYLYGLGRIDINWKPIHRADG